MTAPTPAKPAPGGSPVVVNVQGAAPAAQAPKTTTAKRRAPSWWRHPQVWIAVVLVLVLAELVAFLQLGWLWWTLINVGLIVAILTIGTIIARGAFWAALGTLFSGRWARRGSSTTRTTRAASSGRSGGSGGGILGRLRRGGSGGGSAASGNGSGRSRTGLGRLWPFGKGRGSKSSGGVRGGSPDGTGRRKGRGGADGTDTGSGRKWYWPFGTGRRKKAGTGTGGASGTGTSGGTSTRKSRRGRKGGTDAGTGTSTSGGTDGAKKPKGGFWRGLKDDAKAGWKKGLGAAGADSDKKDKGGKKDEPKKSAPAATTKPRPATKPGTAKPSPAPKTDAAKPAPAPKTDTAKPAPAPKNNQEGGPTVAKGRHRPGNTGGATPPPAQDHSLFTFGAALGKLPEIVGASRNQAAQAAQRCDRTAAALRALAQTGATEVPANKGLAADVEAVAAKYERAAREAEAAVELMRQAEVESSALHGRFRRDHDHDLGRKEGERAPQHIERRADVSYGD